MKRKANAAASLFLTLTIIPVMVGCGSNAAKAFDYNLDEILEANEISADEFEGQYGMTIREYAEDSGIVISLLYERVFDFLVENGTAV